MARDNQEIFEHAVAKIRAGALPDAERLLAQVLHDQPNHFGALNLRGILLLQMQRFPEAEATIRQAIAVNAQSDSTFYNHGLVLKILQRPRDAVDAFSKAIALNPSAPELWNSRGAAYNDLRQFKEAQADFEKAVALRPDYVEAFYNMGGSHLELGNYPQALTSYDAALRLAPNFPEALANRGQVLDKQERFADAIASYDRALAIRPDFAEVHCYRGNALSKLKRFEEALSDYDRALAIRPNFAEAHCNRGNALQARKKFEAALQSYDAALAIRPTFADAMASRGNALQELGRLDEAVGYYDRAIALQPDLAEAHYNRGNAHFKLRQFEDAVASYGRAYDIDRGLKYLMGIRLHAKMQLCDWRDLDNETAELIAALKAGKPATSPFPLLGLASTAADQLKCAKMFSAEEADASALKLWQGERYSHDRIRLAYVSAEFHQHPVPHLLAGLIEAHDRTRFETIAISLAGSDGSAMRARLETAFAQFIDAQNKDDAAVAKLMREIEIDIAVDLTGHTGRARPAIFVHRPAPIQVNYLGFAGTIGPQIDYLIGDRHAIPESQRPYFCENVVDLPDTFIPYDSKLVVSAPAPSRAGCGLPGTGFVFCAFNNAFKLAPQIFDVWMRLLSAIDGSLLWLSQANEAAMRNLRREAEARGVDQERMIFAPRTDRIEDHLARLGLADLFLDTLPYNAHSTAADALRAGVPVLTCRGETFAGRVATSLDNAVGLPEMVTNNLAEYEALALKLAREPPALADIKAKLARNRASSPLFDTQHYARQIESAYKTMWDIWQRGETPRSFGVERS